LQFSVALSPVTGNIHLSKTQPGPQQCKSQSSYTMPI
jgi:hypothetical protein